MQEIFKEEQPFRQEGQKEQADIELRKISPEIFEELFNRFEHLDEGSEGVIMLLDSERLDPLLKERLREIGMLVNFKEGERVFKLLKVYKPGAVYQEAKMQEKARSILDEHRQENDSLAKVPAVDACFEVEILNAHSSFLTDLKRHHLNVEKGSKVEMIVMDFAPGIDLRSYIIEKLIASDPYLQKEMSIYKRDLKYDQNQKLPYNVLRGFIERYLNFVEPPIEEGSAYSWDYAKNISVIQARLEKANVVLSKRIFEILDATVKVLQQAGFFHNDLHERNILVDEDDEGSIRNLWLLDFAYAGKQDFSVRSDKSIIYRWRQFSKTRQEKAQEKYGQLLEIVNVRAKELKQKSIYQQALKSIGGIIGSNDIKSLAEAIKQQTLLIEPVMGDKFNTTEAVFWFFVYKKNPQLAKKVIGQFLEPEILRKKEKGDFRASNYNFWEKLQELFSAASAEELINDILPNLF